MDVRGSIRAERSYVEDEKQLVNIQVGKASYRVNTSFMASTCQLYNGVVEVSVRVNGPKGPFLSMALECARIVSLFTGVKYKKD